MIQDDKKYTIEYNSGNLYQGFKNMPQDMVTCLVNNGFTQMASISGMMYFGAKTVNNLPMLLEIVHPHNEDRGIKLNYKVPVLPLKPMAEEALKHIFGHR